ncbi:HTH domain-containing protein [Listeria weihenstephanensis FSL R9-0317]|uniref:DNA-binding protein n=1 Tax=Listeria weihenstephanensis TaxID=1006155 RepID=A0A1S7FUB1_9LIST|nr:hypothetical protein [Listeria weihenstephanensis]AQY51044.1 hypothetical protein UE46_08295 [Listeria weihenstephanensis]EUJ36462.1 HTH domain-containing protein [Listeria weihenstephanensis FSL R9-0317]
MFGPNDDILKQKIVAILDEYIMSQKQAAEMLNMDTTNVTRLVKDKRINPLYVFNKESPRTICLFYRKDVESYHEVLNAYRKLRKKFKHD